MQQAGFKLRRALQSMGETPAISDRVAGPPDKPEGRRDRVLKPKLLSPIDNPRIFRVLNALATLKEYQRLTSILNIKRIEAVNQFALPPLMVTLVQKDIINETVVGVFPEAEAAEHPDGTLVFVNGRDINYSRIVYGITAKGTDVRHSLHRASIDNTLACIDIGLSDKPA